MLTDAEYEVYIEETAQNHHKRILTRLDQESTPWWIVFDMLDQMNDDVATRYTKAMKAELEAHPNYFAGSAESWWKENN